MGNPLVENKRVSWFLGLSASWFLGFLVSWVLGLKVQSCKVTKLQRIKKTILCLLEYMVPYYQIAMSCFLEDIDPIFKILKKFRTDIDDLSVPVFSKVFKQWLFRNLNISHNNMFEN